MSNKVLEHLAGKKDKVKMGVKSAMGGRLLDYEAKRIKNEGISKGKLETLVGLIKYGLLSVKGAAKRLQKNVEEFKLLL